MLEELRRIENPIIRMAVAATTACSIVASGAAIAIGVTSPQSETVHRPALYAALAAAGVGAAVGLGSGRGNGSANNGANPAQVRMAELQTAVWKDWRNFVVTRKVKESAEITSFYLKPEDGGELPQFQPGQFLTIKLTIPGQSKPVIRTYSLSDDAASGDYYRLSIKREPAPPGLAVPAGVASNFMHDAVQEGAIIPAKPPSGRFVLEVQKDLPVVLISNGVGITPMISMAKACSRLHPARPIWFLHGARDGSYHAFREEVLAVAQQNPNLQVHFCYSRPRPEDMGYYHSTGYIDIDLIKTLVAPALEQTYGSTHADYFLCGSPAFMQSLRQGLQQWGVPDPQVFFESFGGGRPIAGVSAPSVIGGQPIGEQPIGEPVPSGQALATPLNGKTDSDAEVVFTQSDQTLTWHPDDGTLLEFAEANDLDPAYSCRQGICLTCMCKLQAGDVEYVTPPIGTPDPGSVLICIAKPKTAKVVLEL
jgi:uncharacterized protein